MSAARNLLLICLAATAAGSATAQAMDHGAMQMQGGDPPADARDPHAYSGGYRMGTGLYALPHQAGTAHQMEMADGRSFGSFLADRLERAGHSDGVETAYDLRASYGTTYDKLVLKAEGEAAQGRIGEARTELLWGHAVGGYWDTQLGLRNDAGHARPGRNWLAFGVQGLAPYWFELEATAYVGEGGRTALRLAGEYELLITQRLILQPRVEANLYGRDDPEARLGSGLSSGTAGLRLRYEISRQFAPYVGVERAASFGGTADYARAAGARPAQTRWVAGVRMWF
ncbi:copper resistance protein B [Xylophilus rhododendri]|uniref:Copper resistance protein B n=1 Tax=Xylophilus rhododendri TaxID=2697032 RepID=A0A857J5S6_9BURK|nr:copper resistance protein B [Xylophilus rhododendri]QHI99330.1 copper resistance protein B [Xylophilus rhododendri]